PPPSTLFPYTTLFRSGSNITPLEVESALVEHPAIALAAVVGVHDTVHGENVRAYVTVREGAPQPSSAEVIRFCRDRVGYKAPERSEEHTSELQSLAYL